MSPAELDALRHKQDNARKEAEPAPRKSEEEQRADLRAIVRWMHGLAERIDPYVVAMHRDLHTASIARSNRKRGTSDAM